MKPKTIHLIIIFFSQLAILSLKAQESTLAYTPGPANLNPETFAHIYFLREQADAYPDNWLAVVFNNDNGFCVKAKMNHIYRVNTKLEGPTKLHTKIKDVITELSLYLEPGKNYYISLKPEQLPNGSIKGNLEVLDNLEGQKRLQQYNGIIQQRYCIVPINGNHDFRENTWNDTIYWYAGKTHEYHFMPLPSWELLLRENTNTTLAFRNPLISESYSEAGGIRYLPLKKCATLEAFNNYCHYNFITSTLDKQHDSLINTYVTSVNPPQGITYARLVTIENRNRSPKLNEVSPLIMHSVYVVFFWTDQKGKGNSACLYLSERGLANELHTIATLQEHLLWVWNSFDLVKTK